MSFISLSDVGRRYPGPPPVLALQDVNLDISAGDYCAIKGPSGSGKSTLLNLLGLLDVPDDGDYRINGQSIRGLKPVQIDQLRAKTFGFVFQSAHMLGHWSVAANVALGLRAQASPRSDRSAAVQDALKRVGMAQRARASAANLSGGERQRAAIARAISTNPSVLLADEPTGNLDSANARGVLDIFDQVHALGVTLLVVTHDDRVADRAERLIEVSDGRIVSGAHP